MSDLTSFIEAQKRRLEQERAELSRGPNVTEVKWSDNVVCIN